MTEPTTEFEVGSFHFWSGKKYEYIGPSQGRIMGCFRKPSGEYVFIAYEQTEPWNPDPKGSCEDELEAIALEIEFADEYLAPHEILALRREWATRLRALKPAEQKVTYALAEGGPLEVVSISIAEATALLKAFNDRWPGGLEEIESTLAAKLGDSK